MCTAITFEAEDFYFGRTLDYDFLYPSQVVIAPRNFDFGFENHLCEKEHYALTGMAYVHKGYPLYYDAVNECGLCMAGLNFTGNAVYGKEWVGKENVASYELIPYVLSLCKSVKEARVLLQRINITDRAFSEDLPVSQLHFIVADKCESIVVESVKTGVEIYDNPVGVLSNNPTFPYHMMNLANYMNVSPHPAENRFSDKVNLCQYSRGMGAIGLPGDFSSQSRFVRAAFVKLNSVVPKGEIACVNQFFRIMDTVFQTEGVCVLEEGRYEKTLYTCCMNAQKGIYYYTTYDNRRISGVDMHREELDCDRLKCYLLRTSQQIEYIN